MSSKCETDTRRMFLKKLGVFGAASLVAPVVNEIHAGDTGSSEINEPVKVPTRPYGKTGENVSVLSLGGVLDVSDLLVFHQAFKMGVTYWDTADGYGWGKNEKAIGKYFAKFPDNRKQIFLVTKASSSNPQELTEKLNRSLDRMKTSYIDLYFIHYVKNVRRELTDDVKAWAEKMKSQGKIRFFGFSAHKNMENSMIDAAKLGWIDGIMMSYNYRLMVKDEMKRAVDACAKAGIGLTAMKTQAAFSANFYATIGSETDDALGLTENLLEKGYTAEQAKLRVVWENQNIASICSAMPNMTILQANVSAALNKIQLSRKDRLRLEQYAERTSSGYCTGCASLCESTVNRDIPICDILRYSMYHHGYGDRETASRLFSALPTDVKNNILGTDYKKAESVCPQQIKISKILKEIYHELT